jgi:hypothetical protein
MVDNGCNAIWKEILLKDISFKKKDLKDIKFNVTGINEQDEDVNLGSKSITFQTLLDKSGKWAVNEKFELENGYSGSKIYV